MDEKGATDVRPFSAMERSLFRRTGCSAFAVSASFRSSAAASSTSPLGTVKATSSDPAAAPGRNAQKDTTGLAADHADAAAARSRQ